MGQQGDAGDRFRQRLRAERERRGWSQSELAAKVSAGCYASTIAKIEAGSRAVRIDEIDAISDIFGISVDVLIGRTGRTADLAWAMSKLTSNAQKYATEILGLRQRLAGDVEDVLALVNSREIGERIRESLDAVQAASQLLVATEVTLNTLANQFPIPKG